MMRLSAMLSINIFFLYLLSSSQVFSLAMPATQESFGSTTLRNLKVVPGQSEVPRGTIGTI